MKYYRDYKGPDFIAVLNVYRWDGLTAERWDSANGGWVEVDRNWWLDRIEGGDPTLDQISKSTADRLTRSAT